MKLMKKRKPNKPKKSRLCRISDGYVLGCVCNVEGYYMPPGAVFKNGHWYAPKEVA